MSSTKWISRLYIIFLGIILSMTTGFGIAAFYPQPVHPNYPISRPVITPESCSKTPESAKSEECVKLAEEQTMDERKSIEEYEAKNIEFENKNAGYTRTAVFLGVSIGALFVTLSLIILKSSKLVSNGFMLAGVLTAVLTRFLIMLASFGSDVSGSNAPNTLSVAQFVILVAVSLAVIYAGLKTIPDEKETRELQK